MEDHPKVRQMVDELRRRMLRSNDRLFTSAMSVGEVLVKPLSTGNAALAGRYRAVFTGQHLTISAFDLAAAEAYDNIRKDRTVQRADAIQLACAESPHADLCLANDDRLSQKSIPGVSFFITSLGRAPL